MKILLVSSNITTSPYPVYPLGAAVIAGSLRAGGHDVRQFDCLMKDNSMEMLRQDIREYRPELIGISIRNIDNVNLMNEQYYIDTVKDMIKAIRTVSDSRIILGGAGFSLMPELILQKTAADYGIVGEGEVPMLAIADNAEAGSYPSERLISAGERLSGSDIAPADYDDQLLEFYLHSGNIAPLQTKRGCTRKCIYCSYPVLEGSRIRQRDPRSVVDDMELLANKHKAKYIFFVDSVFNDDEGAYIELLEEMARRRINIPWTGFFKPCGLTDEIVEMMKGTGLIAVEIGSDAACDTTLEKLGKGFRFRDITACGELFARHNVAVSHYFMFGGPGENKQTVTEGIGNIGNLKKCVVFIFMGIRILPHTPLSGIAMMEKIISSGEMLEPVYYISPALDKKWLEDTLTKAFAKIRHCIFPPDTFDSSLRALHRMGYTGTLWELLLPGKKRPARRRHAAK